MLYLKAFKKQICLFAYSSDNSTKTGNNNKNGVIASYINCIVAELNFNWLFIHIKIPIQYNPRRIEIYLDRTWRFVKDVFPDYGFRKWLMEYRASIIDSIIHEELHDLFKEHKLNLTNNQEEYIIKELGY
jgi:hypothetical protein